jgi:hypothetical protein
MSSSTQRSPLVPRSIEVRSGSHRLSGPRRFPLSGDATDNCQFSTARCLDDPRHTTHTHMDVRLAGMQNDNQLLCLRESRRTCQPMFRGQ